MPRISYDQFQDRRVFLLALVNTYPAITSCISSQRHYQLSRYFALGQPLTDAGVRAHWQHTKQTEPKLAPKANKTFFFLFDLFEDTWQACQGDPELGLLHGSVTSDLWCREVPLEGCAPCPGPIPESSART